MIVIFWRVILFLFGWIPETMWWKRMVQRRREWQCRAGHVAPVRIVIPVGIYEPKRTAIIQRRFRCHNCGALLPWTWKGTMSERRRQAIGNVLAASSKWQGKLTMLPRPKESR